MSERRTIELAGRTLPCLWYSGEAARRERREIAAANGLRVCCGAEWAACLPASESGSTIRLARHQAECSREWTVQFVPNAEAAPLTAERYEWSRRYPYVNVATESEALALIIQWSREAVSA